MIYKHFFKDPALYVHFKKDKSNRKTYISLHRNVLHRDYAKFLYENSLPRDFNKQELEKAAKEAWEAA